jgi:hypothetical protein
MIYRACDDYVGFLEQHPQLFLLLVEHRSADDPLADGKEFLATGFAKLMGDTLRRLGVDAGAAEPWAHGVIGMGLSVGEWHLRRDIMSRSATAEYLAAFIWNAFNGFAAEVGVVVDGVAEIRLVAKKPTRSRKDA